MQEVSEAGAKNAPGQQQAVDIILDEVEVTSPAHRNTGRGIRELGPADRVEGFETQKLTAQGKKEKTIADNEEIELHEREKFRTVPNNGGPGATF